MDELPAWAAEMHQRWRQSAENREQIEKAYAILLQRLREATASEREQTAAELDRLLKELRRHLAGSIENESSKNGSHRPLAERLRSLFAQNHNSQQPRINRLIAEMSDDLIRVLTFIGKEIDQQKEVAIGFDSFLKARAQEILDEENHNVTYHIGALMQRLDSFSARIEDLAQEQTRIRSKLSHLHQALKALTDEFERIDHKPHVDPDRYLVERLHAALSRMERMSGAAENESVNSCLNQENKRTSTSLDRFVNQFRYSMFEEVFRGSREWITERLRIYLPFFESAPEPLLEIGSGRGEFLEWMESLGKSAYGVDTNFLEVEELKSKGLNVYCQDALEHVQSLPEAGIGGVFCAQVVEHLPPEYVSRMISALYRAMMPNAPLIIETLNTTSMFSFHHLYFKDPTHVFPVHPEILVFFLRYSGFRDVSVRYITPPPDCVLLPSPPADHEDNPIHRYLDQLVQRLNELIFNRLEYFVVGYR